MSSADQIIELSSDSSLNDSPVNDNKENDDLLQFDSTISSILKKYNVESTIATTSTITSSKESPLDYDYIPNLYEYDYLESYPKATTSSSESTNLNMYDDLEKGAGTTEPFNINGSQEKKKRKLNSNSDKEQKALEKAALKLKKQEEREQKKLEVQKEKALKKALSASNKNLKPEECIKFVTVQIDTEIVHEAYGSVILENLRTAGFQVQTQSKIIPRSVSWIRKKQTPLIDDNTQLHFSSDTEEVDELLLVMNWKEIIDHIHNKTLTNHVKSVHSILNNKHISLAIYGLENYFKYQKSLKNRELRENDPKKSNKYDKIYKDVPIISRKNIEYALTELQLVCNCCYRQIETPEHAGSLIVQFSKAVAQIPFKMQRNEKFEQRDWFMAESNKDCVRVDKDGNGLQRLWNQQLTTFPLARLETAEAIISQYPTPSLLMQAYQNCSTESEGQQLLQDIVIRRAAGNITSSRKIGPELSKKLYLFFTSTDGDVIL